MRFASRMRDIGAGSGLWLDTSLTSNPGITNQADFSIIPSRYQQRSCAHAVRQHNSIPATAVCHAPSSKNLRSRSSRKRRALFRSQKNSSARNSSAVLCPGHSHPLSRIPPSTAPLRALDQLLRFPSTYVTAPSAPRAGSRSLLSIHINLITSTTVLKHPAPHLHQAPRRSRIYPPSSLRVCL
jgi:hypothetical protein